MTPGSRPGRRRRILFLAEGATMTHFVRPLVCADSLDPAAYDVVFCAPRRYHPLLENRRYPVHALEAVDSSVFLNNLQQGSLTYDADTIRRYVAEDRRLMQAHRPDLVIGDYRLSLLISAPLERVPYAPIFSAHWRRRPGFELVLPEVPGWRRLPAALLQPIFRLISPAILRHHAWAINRIRKEFGLAAIPGDLREIYTTGDLMLYPDVPEFSPTPGAPAHHHYIGPCLWAPQAPRPAWWNEMVRDPAPKVFISMGSSGSLSVLPNLFRALSGLPVKILLSSSGREVPAPPGAFVADLLPYEETAQHARVVVSHGGISALYPTLAAGAPTLGIPANADQHLCVQLLERSGAGVHVRSENATVPRLRRALNTLLTRDSFRQAAARWPALIARSCTPVLFPRVLDRFFAERP